MQEEKGKCSRDGKRGEEESIIIQLTTDIRRRRFIMEEMRSFGYICPKCGKAQIHQRSRFALSAAVACAARHIRLSAVPRACWKAAASA